MKRIQFDLLPEKLKDFDALKDRARLKTRMELFNYALSLFDWAINVRDRGDVIGSMRGDDFTELLIPPFSRPKKRP